MKRNLISIVILALLIVNIVLTAIMMFSVTSTNRKTAELVSDVASAISIDISSSYAGGGAGPAVPLEDTVTYTISDLQIPMKRAEGDDKDHYGVITVTLSMNSKHEDYKTYGEGDLSGREDLIRGQIFELIEQYTMDEAKANSEQLKTDILAKVQELFGSDFIFDVTLVALYQ